LHLKETDGKGHWSGRSDLVRVMKSLKGQGGEEINLGRGKGSSAVYAVVGKLI
jgi:hypothetical protein